MEFVEAYDHQDGVHCGATALRNVSAYYGWHFSESACFGIGGGAAFVRHDPDGQPWDYFRSSPEWLEAAFFERLGVPHSIREGDDFEAAWQNVTARVDDDDPVLVSLDPGSLPYLRGDPPHLPPHVAVVVGYDAETVVLSDGALERRQDLPRETFREAWSVDGHVSLTNQYLAVTRARITEEETDAAAAGLRQAATYMLDPLEVTRDARGPGTAGVDALRSFADQLATWPDLADAVSPVQATLCSIDEHGGGRAYRGLFAETLEGLGQRTGLSPDLAHRMERVGQEWETVAEILSDGLEGSEPDPGSFQAAASVLADVADREESIFEELASELGRVHA